MPSQKRIFGDKGETIAKEFLQNKGYQIIEENFLVKQGEIDIIAKKETHPIFIEVKTRKSKQFGTGLETVTVNKRRKIIKTIKKFFITKGKNPEEQIFQVDIITIFFSDQNRYEINHYEDILSFSDF